MKKELFEELLNILMSTGADFAEIYYEETYNKTYDFNTSKLDSIKTTNKKGVGFRIFDNKDYYYASTNILLYDNLKETAYRLSKKINRKNNKKVSLLELEDITTEVKIPHNEYSTEQKKQLFRKIDKKIRKKYKEITQLYLSFIEND